MPTHYKTSNLHHLEAHNLMTVYELYDASYSTGVKCLKVQRSNRIVPNVDEN